MRRMNATTSLLVGLLVVTVYIGLQDTSLSASTGSQIAREFTAEPSHSPDEIIIINADPETPMPPGMREQELLHILATAAQHAQIKGLDTVTTQYYAFSTRGIWFAEGGIGGGIMDPNIPIIIVAMPGVGHWKGEGATNTTEPIAIDGVTLAYMVDGNVAGVVSGYRALPFTPDSTYEYFTPEILSTIPTLVPAVGEEIPSGVLAVPKPPQ